MTRVFFIYTKKKKQFFPHTHYQKKKNLAEGTKREGPGTVLAEGTKREGPGTGLARGNPNRVGINKTKEHTPKA